MLLAFKLALRVRVLILATVGEGYIGLLARRLLGLPYVMFAHGNEVLALRDSRWPRAIESLREAQVVMANSRYTAGLLEELGVPAARIRVIHPGCDPDDFRPVELDPATRHRLLEGRVPQFTLLTVGNLVMRKGHDLAIKAVARLRESIPGLLYIIAGAGPHEHELRCLANQLGVADCILFKGRVPEDELAAIYAASDVFLMPSRLLLADDDVEGFGIVFLEASACGRAVIGGMSGGIADAVVHGKTGLLVDPGDVTALQEAILRLWRDPELRGKLGAAGRQRVLSELTWSHFGASVREVVCEAARAAPVGAGVGYGRQQ